MTGDPHQQYLCCNTECAASQNPPRGGLAGWRALHRIHCDVFCAANRWALASMLHGSTSRVQRSVVLVRLLVRASTLSVLLSLICCSTVGGAADMTATVVQWDVPLLGTPAAGVRCPWWWAGRAMRTAVHGSNSRVHCSEVVMRLLLRASMLAAASGFDMLRHCWRHCWQHWGPWVWGAGHPNSSGRVSVVVGWQGG